MCDTTDASRVRCDVCFRNCLLHEGAVGACRARVAHDGKVVPHSYGRLTSLALDPVEKKPLARWMPGKLLLSVGSYGCNLLCPCCQNHHIAQAREDDVTWYEVSPQDLVGLTCRERERDARVVGIAYTYNEPLTFWEYVRDTGVLAHEQGLANVLVSNGCASEPVIDTLAPLVDAANIDLKGFTEDAYRWFGGSLTQVKGTIARLAAEPNCHLEVTTLVIPDINDSPALIDEMATWLEELDPSITYHLTRFFPRWHMSDAYPTPVSTLFELADVARHHLANVRVGNV